MSIAFGTRSRRHVPVRQLRYDRLPLNPTGLDCAQALAAGIEMPPIKVTLRRDGSFFVRDGRHRTLAHKLCGLEMIDAIVSVPKEEFFE